MSTLPPAEPAIDVRTIADLPFHAMGRFQKPMVMGRVRSGEIRGLSSKELLEQVRDLSLGLSALGMGPRDRIAIVSESSKRLTEKSAMSEEFSSSRG